MNSRLPKRSIVPGWRGCWRLLIWSLTGSCSSTRSRPLPGAPTVGVSTTGGSLDRRVNCRRVSQPPCCREDGARRGEWVGARRSTKGGRNRQRGNPRPPCCPAPRSGALAVGGYKRPRGRERDCPPARSPARPTFSYESPGPSFYRRKERAQVYKGGGVAMC
jgi:hypothetical protein